MDYFDPTYLESVYAALFAQLQTATFAGGLKVQTWQRAHLVPDELPVASQPAVIQVQGPMHVEQKEVFGPAKWTVTALLVIYVRADSTALGQNPLPATLANYVIWGLTQSLETTPPYEKQTLGNLVYHCWIEGAVSIEATREQMVFTVPIYMILGPVG